MKRLRQCDLSRNRNKFTVQGRIYQRYGNSIVIRVPITNNRLIIGTHWPGVLFTIFVILGGTMMNIRILNKTNSFDDNSKGLVRLFIGVMCILTIVFLLMTAGSDPGIVFSNPFDAHTNEEEAELNLQETPYCDVCSVYQVQRLKIHHCEDCNYCIEGMDHHCPWMVCIVKSNVLTFD